jgi:hypothetical protein
VVGIQEMKTSEKDDMSFVETIETLHMIVREFSHDEEIYLVRKLGEIIHIHPHFLPLLDEYIVVLPPVLYLMTLYFLIYSATEAHFGSFRTSPRNGAHPTAVARL